MTERVTRRAPGAGAAETQPWAKDALARLARATYLQSTALHSTPRVDRPRHRLAGLLGVLAVLLILSAAGPPLPQQTQPWPARTLTVRTALAFPTELLGLDAQVSSPRFVVRAHRPETARKTLAMAERGWDILRPHFSDLPARSISIAVIEDPGRYQQVQPAPMTRGFSTFGGTQIVVNGHDLDQEVVTHELAHILLGLSVPRGLQLPDWFNEGFAQFASGTRPDTLQMMYYANGNDFLSLQQLDKVDALRSPDRELATLQGLAVVSFLVDTYGEARFWDLIRSLQTADTLSQAMEGTYGVTDLQLDRLWTAYADQNYGLLSGPALRLIGLVALGGLAALAGGIFMVRETRRRATAAGLDLTWMEIEAARLAEERLEQLGEASDGPADQVEALPPGPTRPV